MTSVRCSTIFAPGWNPGDRRHPPRYENNSEKEDGRIQARETRAVRHLAQPAPAPHFWSSPARARTTGAPDVCGLPDDARHLPLHGRSRLSLRLLFHRLTKSRQRVACDALGIISAWRAESPLRPALTAKAAWSGRNEIALRLRGTHSMARVIVERRGSDFWLEVAAC